MGVFCVMGDEALMEPITLMEDVSAYIQRVFRQCRTEMESGSILSELLGSDVNDASPFLMLLMIDWVFSELMLEACKCP